MPLNFGKREAAKDLAEILSDLKAEKESTDDSSEKD